MSVGGNEMEGLSVGNVGDVVRETVGLAEGLPVGDPDGQIPRGTLVVTGGESSTGIKLGEAVGEEVGSDAVGDLVGS